MRLTRGTQNIRDLVLTATLLRVGLLFQADDRVTQGLAALDKAGFFDLDGLADLIGFFEYEDDEQDEDAGEG